MTVLAHTHTQVMADAEEERKSRAWNAYLEATKRLIGTVYEEVEPLAWESLQERLKRLRDRFARLA